MSAADPGFLARAAIGLWLCGIGVLGFLQFYLRTARAAQTGTIAWLWLAGAILITSIGIVLVARARRSRPR